MIKLIILGLLFLIAVVFIILVKKSKGFSYSSQDSKELFTGDVVDDDFDDHFEENDWKDDMYNTNDFDDNNFEFELDDRDII